MLIAFIALYHSLSMAQTYPKAKVDAIESIIEMHQEASSKRHGQLIQLKFVEGKSHSAYGGTNGGPPRIVIFSGFINDYTDLELVAVTCHELGHILGTVGLRDATYKVSTVKSDSPDGTEGEADYFAGSCLMTYLKKQKLPYITPNEECSKIYSSKKVQLCSWAVSTVTSTYEKMYKTRIDYKLAMSQQVPGIMGIYPNKSVDSTLSLEES